VEGSRYDDEEIEQLLRVIMLYHILFPYRYGGYLTELVSRGLEDCGAVWVDRSDFSLYNKIISLSKRIYYGGFTNIMKI
jgi:hypothetical protein